MNILPDTSFLLDLMRGARPAVDLWDDLAREGAVAHLSPLVLFELRFGFAWKGDRLEQAQFEAVAATMPTAALSEHAASHAADMQVHLMRRGIPMAQIDCLLAGTAAAGRFILVTADRGLARVAEAGIPVRTY